MEPALGDGPEISFSIGAQAAGTKGLINPTSSTDPGLAVQGTQLRVFDILTNFIGTVGDQTSTADNMIPITYIDGTLQYVNTTAGVLNEDYWKFVDEGKPEYYRWTKTGLHKFFGYLTKDPEGNPSPVTVNMGTDQKLAISSFEMTPAKTQFDFLFSNIHKRDMAGTYDPASAKYAYVPLEMRHLFTALAVNIVNKTVSPITIQSISFLGVHPTQSAEIDWSESETNKTYPFVTYTPGAAAELVLNTEAVTVGAASSADANSSTTKALFTGTEGKPNSYYRLLWPQSGLDGEGVALQVKFSDNEIVTKPLAGVFKKNNVVTNEMSPGYKYLLEITITAEDLKFKVILVDPLDEHYYNGMNGDHSDYLIKF